MPLDVSNKTQALIPKAGIGSILDVKSIEVCLVGIGEASGAIERLIDFDLRGFGAQAFEVE